MDCSPLVSVYIATHNRKELLERAVASVFAQKFKRLELIIVDDASDDGTWDYLRRLAECSEIVKVFRNQKSAGPHVSRNIAIENAGGELVTGLDDDDWFSVDRVRGLVNGYDPAYSFVSSNYIKISRRSRKRSSLVGRRITLRSLGARNVVGSQVLAERQRLLDVGGFDERLSGLEDYDLWIRLVKRFGPAKRIRATSYVMDLSGASTRKSQSATRYLSAQQLIAKHPDVFHGGKAAYRLDWRSNSAISWRTMALAPWRYGMDVCWEVVRNQAHLG